MNAIIFGANGQDGFYLHQVLQREGVNVIQVSRSGSSEIIKGNVTNKVFVDEIIKSCEPDYIFNFAATSATLHDLLFENHETISTGTLIILDAVYKYSRRTKVFLCGSGLQFINTGKPIKETDAFDARDGYSIARIQTVYAARYFRTLGLDIYIGYLFNHDSPLRSVRHVNQKIARSVLEIATRKQTILELGNPDTMKEFTFAGDVVDAIWTLVNNKQGIKEAVIGSGIAYPLMKWVEFCFEYYHLDWHKHLKVSGQFVSEYSVLVSDPETIKSLGWNPKINFDQLGKMFCEANEAL